MVGSVEGEFATAYEGLVDRLGKVEAEIAEPDRGPGREALEQIAFVRVGLRCIADAIGELAAVAVELDEQREHPACPARARNRSA